MSAITTRKMTVAEYVEWGERPENADRRTELVDGEVVEVPSPRHFHCLVCNLVGHYLTLYFFKYGSGYTLNNDGGIVLSPTTMRGPDVSAFTGVMTDDDEKGYGVRMPVLCVEVVSPSDRPTELHKRVTQYHAAGIPIVWVVQPGDRAVFVHRKGKPVELFEGHDELTAEPELPGFACRVSAFFTAPGRG